MSDIGNSRKNCHIYRSKKMNNKMKNMVSDKKIYSYVKYKNDSDLDTYEKQKRNRNYFKKTNMNGYEPEHKINSYYVLDEEECMDKCIEESCESLQYVSNNIESNKMKDDYIEMYDLENTKKEIDDLKNRKYTDCFQNDYENYEYMKRRINMECKKKYGDEYLFVDDLSILDSILKCDSSDPLLIQGECVMNLNNTTPIEFFENQISNKIPKSLTIFFMILVIIVFGILFCYS